MEKLFGKYQLPESTGYIRNRNNKGRRFCLVWLTEQADLYNFTTYLVTLQ